MKIFQFFSAYLLEINEAQLKNQNYNVFLSVLLVSMEVGPKGFSISVWHLPVEIKVHVENIRTKRKTSEAYSQPCQTSKMKLFAKTLNRFQLLTIVLIA